MSQPILPGATIGVLGGGQLGRMLGIAARQMGYRFHVFTPEANSPAGQVADVTVIGEYADLEAVRGFADHVDIVTFEFENVPAETARACSERTVVRPDGTVLHVTQNRLREKQFLHDIGVPTTRWAPVTDPESLVELGRDARLFPAVLKTAGFGYDGKGQVIVRSAAEADAAWSTLGEVPCILEQFVSFVGEVSVVAARGADGLQSQFVAVENVHENHILDVTTAPASILTPLQHVRAIEIAESILDELDVVGVLCIEFFVDASGELLVNELAPRPQNPGHFTIDACVTSQFEQQLRAVCTLPLGDPSLQLPGAAMANLLGDLWQDGEPDWPAMMSDFPGVRLHLYGKSQARAGRKMGHLTASAATGAAAAIQVRAARAALRLR